MKICIDCKKEKPLDQFSLTRKGRPGVRRMCIACFKERKRLGRVQMAAKQKCIPESKVCSVCHIKKSSVDFQRDAQLADGLRCSCKDCSKNIAKKSSDKRRAFFAKNPIEKKKCCHCHEIKAVSNFYRAHGSIDGFVQYCKPCMLKTVKTRSHLATWWYRRSFTRGKALASGDVKPLEVKKLYDAQPFCSYCGVSLRGGNIFNVQVDHKVPKARGGTDKIENLCIACKECNRMKHTMTDTEFRAFLLEYISRFDHPITSQIKMSSLSEYAQKESRP